MKKKSSFSWQPFHLFSIQNKLFPTIVLHWKHYQEKLINRVKGLGEPIIIAGDGRHDSMGHSAKYGAYTIFCCTLPLIIHFSLVQVSYMEGLYSDLDS